MKILALDSATSACSVAIWVDGEIVAAERADLPRGQAEALAPMVARVRDAAGLAFASLDRFAVTVGPGHFTGLRAGLATARGLALATRRPLIGIGTLEALAAAVPERVRGDAVVVAALDSKREEAYVRAFDAALRPLDEPGAQRPADYARALLTAHSQAKFVVAGDAAGPLVEALSAGGAVARATAPLHPDAAVVAQLAAVAPEPDALPGPLYLHAAETTTGTRRT
jgi:tRNA threonylcarbamoyladenosine biosynthesis protein TsaB